MRVTRKQFLWLFIWILIFFLFFCIWNKLQSFKPETITSTQTVQSHSAHLKERHLKVLKEQNSVTISGIVASKEEKNKIIDAYGKVFQEVNHDALSIDKNVKEDLLLDFFTNFADNLSHFESGYLAYNNGTVEIDGLAEDTIVQQTLQEQIDALHNIEVDNHLMIKTKIIPKVIPTNESKEENLSTTEEVTIPTTLDIQKSLDKLLENRRVQFLYARDILTSDSKTLVDTIITLLEKNKDVNIEILGHTDSDGTRKNNLKLSKRRAESIRKYMMRRGIGGEHLKAIGYGESKPLVPNDTLKNRQINRRVEFKVIGE